MVKTPHCGAGQTAVDGNQSGGKFADNPLFQITVFNWIIAVFDWIIGGCGSLFAGDLDGRDYLRKRMLPALRSAVAKSEQYRETFTNRKKS